MTSAREAVTAAEFEEQPLGEATEFPALTRLARVLLAAGALCVCGAVLALATSALPLSGLTADLASVGVALAGGGLVGLAVRWPPGETGGRAMAVLAVAVVAVVGGLVGLGAVTAGLGPWSAPVLAISYPAVSDLLVHLVLAGLLRHLLWRSGAPPPRPPVPWPAWRLCLGFGLASLLLRAVARLLPQPFGTPPFDTGAGLAVGQAVRRVAEVSLGAALLAAVLLSWLHARAPQVGPAGDTGKSGDDVQHDAAQQSWDAVPALAPTPANLARRLVAVGLGALILSGVVQSILYGNIDGPSTTGWLAIGGLVVSLLLPVAGAAALTAGLVGLVLERSLPLPAPAVDEPPGETGSLQPAAPEPVPEADPDARWRP